MPDTSAVPEVGDHIVDSNGVVWIVGENHDRATVRWEARVDRDSVRAYDTPDEDPVVLLDQVIGISPLVVTTTKDLTDKINLFAKGNKQNVLLRVRASPDAPPAAAAGGLSAGLFWALLLVAALAAGGKRRR